MLGLKEDMCQNFKMIVPEAGQIAQQVSMPVTKHFNPEFNPGIYIKGENQLLQSIF